MSTFATADATASAAYASAYRVHMTRTAVRGVQPAPRSVPRLRLTKRGRAVLTFLAATPLVIAAFAFALQGESATASLDGSGTPFEYVTIESGESLWQVAEAIAPQADPRDVILEIQQLNQLETPDVLAGQQVAIPAKYTH